MELINNRYKIIKNVYSGTTYDSILISDTVDNKLYKMSVSNIDYFSDSFIRFIKKNFLTIKNFDPRYIKNIINIDRIYSIDEEQNSDNSVFFLSEYTYEQIDFFKYVKSCSLIQKIEMFVFVCQATNYIHLSGFTYGGIFPDSVIINNCNDKIEIKLDDIVIQGLKFSYGKKTYVNYIPSDLYKHTKTTSFFKSKEYDIYSLGVLLIIILLERPLGENPQVELDNLISVSYDKDSQYFDSIKQLSEIIRKIINFNFDHDIYPYKIIQDINSIFLTKYTATSNTQTHNKLFTKLIARNNILQQIIDNLNQKVYLLEGKSGTGKTRLLNELEFYLKLKTPHIFTYTNIIKNSKNNLKKFISSFNIFLSEHHLEKYTKKLTTNDNDYTIDIIIDILKNITLTKSLIIIIDNIHFANTKFISEIFKLINAVKESNILFLISYNPTLLNKQINKNDIENENINTIQIKNFNMNDTIVFIKNLIAIHHLTEEITERLFLETNGNPQLIIHTLNNYINNKYLYQNESTGIWEFDKQVFNKLRNENMSVNIVSQLLNKQISELSEIEISLMQFLSIYNDTVPENWIFEYYSQIISIKEIKSLLNNFLIAGLISRYILKDKVYYSISNAILKDNIYKQINKEKKIKLHKLAISKIKTSKNISDYQSLAYHLIATNNFAEARKNYIKLACKYKKEKKITLVVKELLNALQCTAANDYISIAKITLDLGIHFFDIGDMNKSLSNLKLAEEATKKINNSELLIEVYIHTALVHDLTYDNECFFKYFNLAKDLLNKYKFPKAKVYILRIEALLQYEIANYKECKKICNKIITIANNTPALQKEKANTLRILADIYHKSGNLNTAKKYLKECIIISNKIGHIRSSLYAYINLGNIYRLLDSDRKALEYYHNAEIRSHEVGINAAEILAIEYMAIMYLNKKEYNLAYQHALKGIAKAKQCRIAELHCSLNIILIHICIALNRSMEAKEYFESAKTLLNNKNIRSNTYDFWFASIEYYNYFGEIDKASEFYKKYIPYDKNLCVFPIHDTEIKLKLFEIVMGQHEKIPEALELIKKETNYAVILENAYLLFVFTLLLKNNTIAKNIYDIIIELNEEKFDERHKARVLYIRSFFEPENKILFLHQNLKILISADLKGLGTLTLNTLANYYIERKEYQIAIAYYIESIELVKKILKSIPPDKRLSFFSYYKLYHIFMNVQYLEKNIHNINTTNKNINITKKMLLNYQNKSYVEKYKKKDNFYNQCADFLIFGNKLNIDTENILNMLNVNPEKDIYSLLSYFAIKLLATDAFIMIYESSNDSYVSHKLFNTSLVNLNVFYKIASSSNPVTLDYKQLNNFNIKNSAKTAISYPIKKQCNSLNTSITFAYIYLESIYDLNRIEDIGIKTIKQYENLLGILINSYILEKKSSIDKLTGAFARGILNERLKNLSLLNTFFSIIYYDLDYFKNINDTYGHQVGDIILTKISHTVINYLEKDETLIRYGGEEFIIVIPNTDSNTAYIKAEIIRKAIEKLEFTGYSFNVTISMGISTFGKHTNLISDLIKKADQAMYYSKQIGKNTTTIWSEKLKNIVKTNNDSEKILDIQNFWTINNTADLSDILNLINSNFSTEDILNKFLNKSKNIISAEAAYILFLHNNNIIPNSDYTTSTDTSIFKNKKIESYIKSMKKDYLLNTLIPKKDVMVKTRTSILLIPIIYKNKYLGAFYFTASNYKKEFTHEDAIVQTFITKLVAHICNDAYKNI